MTAMLVLTRKPGERIQVGADIVVTVLEAVGNKVRIGIDAPENVRVLREELFERADYQCENLGKRASPSS
jgi:carbon storage regulator